VSHALYLLDPDPAPGWVPFAGVRPLAELRAGAHLVRERWEAFVGAETTEIFALPHLAGFCEAGVPTVTARHAVAGPAIIGSSTFAPRGLAPALPDEPFRLVSRGITVGWGVPAGVTWERPRPEARPVEVDGVVLHGVHDLIPALEHLLQDDLLRLIGESDPIPRGSTVLGDPAVLALREASVEPGVTFDTRAGPIVLESGVEVRAGTRLEGPLWAGANTQLLGGPIRDSAIGPHCKVRGELAHCVFLGFANKAHDGFVGHSVIGRWVNLGAGTITSDLKNTYGLVRLDVAGTTMETGLQFLGTLLGDHAKTAIGTLLGTGTIVGAGANLFDAVRAPKYVAPFAWGGTGRERLTRDGFLRIAERVLPRRDVAVDDAMRACLTRIYDWGTR
jgi:UDP-N-acetylglucosamine diphosphorylase / glucose-1-phosphate thymidylyltransferase / UDP-N-acetylgalactosamine diphosphorylase / glucosamine-1-phosphate N-acetyltransferase / galactosamine-1-phosphate N-acetyltransferase